MDYIEGLNTIRSHLGSLSIRHYGRSVVLDCEYAMHMRVGILFHASHEQLRLNWIVGGGLVDVRWSLKFDLIELAAMSRFLPSIELPVPSDCCSHGMELFRLVPVMSVQCAVDNQDGNTIAGKVKEKKPYHSRTMSSHFHMKTPTDHPQKCAPAVGMIAALDLEVEDVAANDYPHNIVWID